MTGGGEFRGHRPRLTPEQEAGQQQAGAHVHDVEESVERWAEEVKDEEGAGVLPTPPRRRRRPAASRVEGVESSISGQMRRQQLSGGMLP